MHIGHAACSIHEQNVSKVTVTLTGGLTWWRQDSGRELSRISMWTISSARSIAPDPIKCRQSFVGIHLSFCEDFDIRSCVLSVAEPLSLHSVIHKSEGPCPAQACLFACFVSLLCFNKANLPIPRSNSPGKVIKQQTMRPT